MQDKSARDPRLRRSVGYALVRAFRAVNRASNRVLRPHGLSAEQAHILIVLWLEGAMRMTDLQKIVILSSATLTGAIDRMERAGLVRRVPDPADGRAWLIEPVAGEGASRRAIESTLEAIEEDCFAALTAAERRDLLRLLDKLTASLA
jgi:MarR family transcriptional regulator, organic hydroperoxide resistance regulator